ncbi:MAG: trigger factor family protein, partial [Bacteroidetes bacterium]|nr:trigger factor family protein [Bacteroidota bacterium]
MKTQFNKLDELNATLNLTIEPEDFLPEYEKQIKQINKGSKIPGFRPGHVPKSMIEQKYGQSVLVESVLNIANEKVNQYVKEEKLDILGYPLSNENQPKIDVFTKEQSYEFIFDIGLTPKVDLDLSKMPSFEKMVLSPSVTMINDEIEHICRQFGKQEPAETVVAGDSLMITLTELNEEGEALEGGLT